MRDACGSLLVLLALASGPSAAECPDGERALRAMLGTVSAGAGAMRGDPMAAEVVSNGDLGFVVGDARSDSAGDASLRGYRVEVWRRDPDCRWRLAIEGSGEFAPTRPPSTPSSENEADHAIDDFEIAAQQNDVAAALRTYGLDRGVTLFIDRATAGEGTGAATSYLTAHPLPGAWRDGSRLTATNEALAYATGTLMQPKGDTHRYLEIWQYDSKVANWGLRVLWVGATDGDSRSGTIPRTRP